jgi:hypothetical protein
MMRDSVTVHVDAPPKWVWELISDITNTGRFSPETLDAQWLDGASGPAVGVRFRGHVKRNGRGPMYWTQCRIIECDPGRRFGFAVVVRHRPVNTWRYLLEPAGAGTNVTESFQLADTAPLRLYWKLFGKLRGRTNQRNMRMTLERVKAAAEAP